MIDDVGFLFKMKGFKMLKAKTQWLRIGYHIIEMLSVKHIRLDDMDTLYFYNGVNLIAEIPLSEREAFSIFNIISRSSDLVEMQTQIDLVLN